MTIESESTKKFRVIGENNNEKKNNCFPWPVFHFSRRHMILISKDESV
jgi:hypothetical protein